MGYNPRNTRDSNRNNSKSLNNQNYSDRLKAFLKRNVLSCFLKMARLLLVLIVDGSENEQRCEQKRLRSRASAGGGAVGASPLPQLFEKKKTEKKRNTYFQIKGIFDGIRIFD